MHEYMLFYKLFYDVPYIYIIGCMVYYCVISGLLVSVALLVSKYIDNYFSIIITPFALAFVAMFIDRILNGGYFGLMTIINGKAMKDFYIPLPPVRWQTICFSSSLKTKTKKRIWFTNPLFSFPVIKLLS